MTLKKSLDIIKSMRLISLIVSIILVFSLLSPAAAVNTYTPIGSERAYILALNVCHSSGTGVLISLDMPFIYECPCEHVLLKIAGSYEDLNPIFNLSLTIFPKEHPPKV